MTSFSERRASVLDLKDHFLLLNLTHGLAGIEPCRMHRRVEDGFAAESNPRNQALVLNFFDCHANVLDLEDHFLLLNLTHEAATIEIRRMDRRIKDKFAAESDPKSKALVLSFFDCLANVLDLEDHFLLLNLTPGARPSAVQVPTSMHLPSLTTTPISPPGKVVCGTVDDDDGIYPPPPPPRHGVDTVQRGRHNGLPGYVPTHGRAAWPVDDCVELECALLTDVLGEVRYLTGRMRQDADTQKVCSEWRFAAMVVDRLCLWLFSIFTVVSSGAIFLSAPDAINTY